MSRWRYKIFLCIFFVIALYMITMLNIFGILRWTDREIASALQKSHNV